MTQEYHVTLKQTFLKGFTGAVLQIIKHFIIGVILPVWIYTRLKTVGHGTQSYYKAYLTHAEGSPIYNNGSLLKQLRNTREIYYKNPNPDVLGRSKIKFKFNTFNF